LHCSPLYPRRTPHSSSPPPIIIIRATAPPFSGGCPNAVGFEWHCGVVDAPLPSRCFSLSSLPLLLSALLHSTPLYTRLFIIDSCRKNEVYEMDWVHRNRSRGVELDQYIVAVGQFGGAIAMTRDPKLPVEHQGSMCVALGCVCVCA